MSCSPKTVRICALLIVAFIALPWVSLIPSPTRIEQKTPAFSLPLFSDFDGDHNLDSAELSTRGGVKRIHVTLGTRLTKLLSFDSRDADRGILLSSDLNSDGDLDLIWFSKNNPKHFVMWLGDGHGNFSKGREPANDQNPAQALLHSAASDVLGLPSITDLIAVLQTTTLVGILPSSDEPHIDVSAHALPLIFSVEASEQFSSVLQKRGPPTQHL